MPRRRMTEKQEQTLERMKQVRKEDSIFLREIIKSKLDWAIAERKKGLEVINKQIQQIKDNQQTINKLEGVIAVLTELLESKKENKEEPKKE